MNKMILAVTSILLSLIFANGVSAKEEKVCNKDGTHCKMVEVKEKHGHPKLGSTAKYTNHSDLQNACRGVWLNSKPTGLDTCQQRSDDSDPIDVMGTCGNSVHNGIPTQQNGKCNLHLNLSCRKRDGSWNDTQASCQALLNAPDKLENDDGKVVSN